LQILQLYGLVLVGYGVQVEAWFSADLGLNSASIVQELICPESTALEENPRFGLCRN
jgi:hypothetical protein